ncbi:MAG: PEP-CTERM sorting domain-containing protein [Thermoguttaceae bacterium]
MLHAISGAGTLGVDNSTDLTVDSIDLGTLSIGAGSTLTIAAIPGGPQAELALNPVPEPSTWAMLLLAAMGLGIYRRRQ